MAGLSPPLHHELIHSFHRETSRDAQLEFIVSMEEMVCLFTFLVYRKKVTARAIDIGLLNKSGHFAPAYLGGSNKLRISLEFSLCSDYIPGKAKKLYTCPAPSKVLAIILGS